MALLSWVKGLRASGTSIGELTEDDVVVFVVGPTGAGKSLFVSEVTKSELIRVGPNLKPCTTIVQAIRCELTENARKALGARTQKNIVFVDTPSFNTGHDDGAAEREMRSWLSKSKSKATLAGTIYVHRVEADPAHEPVQEHLNVFACAFPQEFRPPRRLRAVLRYEGVISEEKIQQRRARFQTQLESLRPVVVSWATSFHPGLFRPGDPDAAWQIVVELFDAQTLEDTHTPSKRITRIATQSEDQLTAQERQSLGQRRRREREQQENVKAQQCQDQRSCSPPPLPQPRLPPPIQPRPIQPCPALSSLQPPAGSHVPRQPHPPDRPQNAVVPPEMEPPPSQADHDEERRHEPGSGHPKIALGHPPISEEPAVVNIEDIETDDIVIAVMGPTGAGKSTFIRTASGCNDAEAVGHTLKPFTRKILPIRFLDQGSGRHVVLVDTPGFDNTYKDDEILNEIHDRLNPSHTKQKLLSFILYFHRITDNRMAGSPLRNLRIFQKLCGKDALEKLCLVTTMWDEIEPSIGENRLVEVSQEHWRPMVAQGAWMVCCRNDDDFPKKLIQQILEDNARKAVPIREEIANLKEFEETEEALSQTNQPQNAVVPACQANHDNEGHPDTVLGTSLISDEPVMVNIETLETDDIVIAVVGLTGSGKSTFIHTASGCNNDEGVGHTLKPFTRNILPIRFLDQGSGRHVVLVDTPGFDNIYKSDLNSILNMISDWLNLSYKKQKLLSGILYFHRISDNRVVGTPLRYLRAFRKLCGKDVLEKVFLATTMWHEVEPSVGERRLTELQQEYWKMMITHRAQIVRCRHDDDSSKKVIQQIIIQEDARRAVLIREEILNPKEFKETEAGQGLYCQLEQLVAKQLVLLRRIDEERRRASDQRILEELQREYNDLRVQIDEKEMKLPWRSNLHRFHPRSRE